jgi:hypothetical protein
VRLTTPLIGSRELEEHVDIRYESVDGSEKALLRITGSSLNTSARTSTLRHTNTK